MLIAFILSSCSKLGYGILLWSTEEPPITSGTMLPVYIRSNIDQVWVVGIPENLRVSKDINKMEIPLTMLEFSGSKRKAEKRADEFAKFASVYAENRQDGLPIRDNPDNNSRRVYRLRLGEIIKVLNVADGVPPISTTGDPLPGDWLKVLTHDGVTGYCFSYRLKIFEHSDGPLQASVDTRREAEPDPDLEMVLARKWSAEYYLQMINNRRIDLNELEKKYGFDPGQDTGVARIYLPDMKKEYVYDTIVSDGERAWRFEGTELLMNLRSNTTLAVQYLENNGLRRTLLFAALSADVDDLIEQEIHRRETQFKIIYNQGPVFSSSSYGTIEFSENGNFRWAGYELLVPQLISPQTRGTGRILMDLHISSSFEDRYYGAFSMQFTDLKDHNTLFFLYSFDNQGLRLEVVPDYCIENITVTRRAPNPMVLYFYKDTLF